MPNTATINAVRDVVSHAIGGLQAASDDLGMEEFDIALDHLRIARETIARAERATRVLIDDAAKEEQPDLDDIRDLDPTEGMAADA